LSKADATKPRRRLVAELERRGLIRSGRVREAFLAVPRELFVADFAARAGLEAVYRDQAIVIKHGEHGIPLSSSSEPGIMATMLEHLELEEGMRVLEVGAGTGYNAALLSLLVGKPGQVVSVDVDPEIAAEARRALRASGYRVRVVHADGRSGFVQSAPYDRIIVTASADTVPRPWFEQLADDGLLEAPLRLEPAGVQAIPVLRKTPRGLRSVRVLRGGFMPLRGADEGGTPELPRQPSLSITDRRDHRSEPMLELTGAALATLSRSAKRRLLATALGEHRRQPLGVRADRAALGAYLLLTLPKSRVVKSFLPDFGVATISRDGAGLAVVELHRPDRAKVDSLTVYGHSEAAELLLERVGEWVRRGCPTESETRITVTYEGDRSRITVRWPPLAEPPVEPITTRRHVS
jgi:protein-L-isoaspartate(D-aspartate) O-methyltransferase